MRVDRIDGALVEERTKPESHIGRLPHFLDRKGHKPWQTLTAEIRHNAKLAGLYVVLHTSLSGVFNQAMVQKVGANNFIAKFHPDELAKAVQDAM